MRGPEKLPGGNNKNSPGFIEKWGRRTEAVAVTAVGVTGGALSLNLAIRFAWAGDFGSAFFFLINAALLGYATQITVPKLYELSNGKPTDNPPKENGN